MGILRFDPAVRPEAGRLDPRGIGPATLPAREQVGAVGPVQRRVGVWHAIVRVRAATEARARTEPETPGEHTDKLRDETAQPLAG